VSLHYLKVTLINVKKVLLKNQLYKLINYLTYVPKMVYANLFITIKMLTFIILLFR